MLFQDYSWQQWFFVITCGAFAINLGYLLWDFFTESSQSPQEQN